MVILIKYLKLSYRKDIAEKKKLLNDPKFEATPDKLAKTMHRTNEALEELTNANVLLENETYKLGTIKKYMSNVNEAQTSLIVNWLGLCIYIGIIVKNDVLLQNEFESLFPGSDITQNKINIKNNDFDIFLLYALKKLNYYQDKLSKQEVSTQVNLILRPIYKISIHNIFITGNSWSQNK